MKNGFPEIKVHHWIIYANNLTKMMHEYLFYRFFFNGAKLASYFTYTVLHGWPLEREINKMQCNVLNNFIQGMLHNFMFASQYYKILHASLRCYLESVRHTASTAHAEGETSAAAIREEVFWKRASVTPDEHPPSRALGHKLNSEENTFWHLRNQKTCDSRYKSQHSQNNMLLKVIV